MNAIQFWLFDTDIQIHRLLGDPDVRRAAEAMRTSLAPVAVTAFSRLEFKASYIQDLLLLWQKVRRSSAFEQVVYRVHNVGGRRASRMILQLTMLMKLDLTAPWPKVQGQLLTRLDSQVLLAWKRFTDSVDELLDELNCTRSSESPTVVKDCWRAAVPHCTDRNSSCEIARFMKSHISELKKLVATLESAGPISDELQVIREVAKEIVRTGRYKRGSRRCRSFGDLLIALHAMGCKGLLSSNKKEHDLLSHGLGYVFQEFPYASLRMK